MKLTLQNLPAAAAELLRDLSPEAKAVVLDHATIRAVQRGERLVRQGDAAECVYYVLRGKFDVLRDGRHVVAEIGPGEPIGEIAFFAGLTRTADVQAVRDSDVLELDRETYDKISQLAPSFTQSILRNFGRRLAAATTTAAVLSPRAPAAIGICAAGPVAPPEGMIRKICAALQAEGPARAIGWHDLPAELRPQETSPLSDNALATWLAVQEREYGRLILITGQGNDSWDRAALRQCDFLLLCGMGPLAKDGKVATNPLEQYALPLFRPEHVGLVLWRENAATPISQTMNWLEGRALHLHHHLALDRAGDFARLARFLAGTALGAVLGGGGALGAGHLGSMRAFAQAGVEFDIYGGTSIGSSVALELAHNPDLTGKLDTFEAFFLKRQALSKLTIPLYSVFDHSHFDTELRREFGERRIEDLAVNAFAVSTNLSTNEIFLQRRGLCWQAVRASASIPAALPPFVTDEGEVLVDGAIMDNVPVSAMRRIKPGPNVAIILSPDEDWRIRHAYRNLPTRRRLAGQLALRRHDGQDFPRIIEVVGRAMMVTSSRAMRQLAQSGDLLLEPPAVPGMGLLSWKQIRAQEAAAYDYTSRRLDEAGGFAALMAQAKADR